MTTRMENGVMLLGMAAILYSMTTSVDARAPHDLSNFQGMYACPLGVRVGRPRTYDEVAQLVKVRGESGVVMSGLPPWIAGREHSGVPAVGVRPPWAVQQ